MKLIGLIILIAILILAGIVVGGGVLVLSAFGLGLLLNRVMHLDPFQVTILSLAGMVAFVFLATRIIKSIIDFPLKPFTSDQDDDEDDDDDDDDTEFEEEDISYIPKKMRLRSAPKTLDFSNTRPESRCPCGSGRMYKNCHGSKNPKV